VPEIQKADPRARRQALWVGLIGAAGGALLLWLFLGNQARVRAWFLDNADTLMDNPLLVGLGMLVLMSPVIGLSVYLLVLGQRIVRARRFPPPGMTLSRDTPVLKEGAAVLRGRVVQVAAGVLLTASLGICALVAGVFAGLR